MIDIAQEARNVLAGVFTDSLGKDWTVFPDTSIADVVTKPTILLKLNSIRKMPEAPRGMYENNLSLFIVAPVGSTEGELSEWTFTVLDILEKQTNTNWQTATKATLGDNDCMDISILVRSVRVPDEQPETSDKESK